MRVERKPVSCKVHDKAVFSLSLLKLLLSTAIVLSASLLSAYAYSADFNAEQSRVESDGRVTEKNPDPLESINRVSFWVTDKSDQYILRPVAVAYDFVLPEFANQAVTNVFLNLTEIQVMVNNLLQLKFKNAATDVGRFTINSTVGVLGLFDVATALGLEKQYEDFGQTLGYWGVPSGPYLFIPFLGPSSFRDASGLAVDYFLKPRTYVDHVPTKNTLLISETIDRRARVLDADKVAFGDKYVFLRDFYFNRRNYLINDGLDDQQELDEFFEDDLNDIIFNDLDEE